MYKLDMLLSSACMSTMYLEHITYVNACFTIVNNSAEGQLPTRGFCGYNKKLQVLMLFGKRPNGTALHPEYVLPGDQALVPGDHSKKSL